MKKRVKRLEALVRQQSTLLEQLARALHTHTRTDLAPDSALPLMKQIVDDAARLSKKSKPNKTKGRLRDLQDRKGRAIQ